MSEVVTSSAAISQSGLYAPRQQVFVVERSGNAPDDVTTAEFSKGGLHSNVVTAPRHDDFSTSSLAVNEGPSRARIEVRSLDIALPPSDFVTNVDFAQPSAGGDSPASQPQSGGSASARADVPAPAGADQAPAAPEPQSTPVVVNSDATASDTQEPGDAKKFFAPVIPDGRPAAQKFADTAAAATGAPTATVETPKKFYGQGTEVVAGAVVAHIAPAPTTLYEKAAALRQQGVIRDDGTGETRLYDKVAQADPQQHQGSQDTSLHDKARQVAAVLNGSKKTVVVEVASYTNTAALTAKQSAIVVESTDVTA